MSKRNNKPVWLIIGLVVLAIAVVLLSHMVMTDHQTDNSFRSSTDQYLF